MRTPSGTLHVVDFKTSQIVANIQTKDYRDDKRHWEIKNNIDTLEFKVFDNTEHAATLMQQNLVLKEVRDGRIVPYVITEIEKNSDDRSVIVYASGEWIQLSKAGIIPPQKLEGKTVIEMVDIALAGTKWQKGNLEYASFRSMTIDEFIDPLSFLKKIASLFELEIQYRAEVVGSQIIGRYVDMVKKRGRETGKEITLGKDLLGIKRIENSQNICTTLLGFVKKEGKDFITIADINNGVPYLVDNDAFQRWNEKGQHKFGFYSPETENEDMDAKRLMTLMKTELKKRINTSVSYEVEAQSIGRVFGLAHELINEGDTIRIKDTGFTPKLYLEARAIAGDESFTNPSQDKYVFGDYREIVDPNEELRKIYNRILSSLGNKQEMIDQLDKLVKEANETASNAQKESEAAKTLAEKVQENIKNNTVEIIEAKNPPTTGLIDRKTLWLDISNGKPGILKLWKDGVWDPVVPDIESVKNEVAGQFNEVNETLQGFSRNIIDLKNDQGVIDKKVTSIEQTASGLSSTVSNLNNIVDAQGKKLTEANTKIEQQATAIGAKVELKQVEDYVAGFKIPELKQTVNQNKQDLLNELANKLATEQFNQKMTLIDNRFTLNEQGLDLAAKKTEVYTKLQADGQFATDSYVRDLEGRIQVTEKNILSTVKNGEIISAINQTAETIKISAGKIQLDGPTIANYLKAQELVGVTIKTAPSNEDRFVQLNKQFIELYDKKISRLEMKFFNNSTNNAIIPAIVLGRSQSGGIEGASVWYHNTPLKPDGTDDSKFSSSTLGVVQYYNPTSNQFTYAGKINFAHNGAISLDANDNINILASQQGHIWLKTDTVGIAKSIFVEPSLNFNVTAGNQVVVRSSNTQFYSNNNGTFAFENITKTSGNQILLSDDNHNAELRMAYSILRSSHDKGYQGKFQLVQTGGAGYADLECADVSYTSLTNRSSRTIKSNIRDLELNSLDKIMSVKVQQYNFKSDIEKLYKMREGSVGTSQLFTTKDIPMQYGLILEDTDATFHSDNGDGINLYTLVSLHVDATQKIKLGQDEQQEEIEQLKEKLISQEDRISKLEELLLK